MRLIEDLKWQGKSKTNFLTLVLLIAVFVLLFVGGFTRMIFGPNDLKQLGVENAVGKYVKYEIEFNYGYFSEYVIVEGGEKSSVNRDYIIIFNNEHYMAVLVLPEVYDLFEKQAEETNNYVNRISMVVPTTIEVKGVVKKLEGDQLRHYKQLFDDSFKDSPYVLSYIIDTRAISPILDSVFLSYCAVIAAFCILGYIAYRYYVILSMKSHDMLVQYIKDRPEEKDDIQKFYDTVPEYRGLRMDKDYFLYVGKKGSFFAKSEDIVWAYNRIITNNRGGRAKGLIISDCHYNAIHVGAGQNDAVAIMRYLRAGNENIVLGYSEELYDLYSNDMEAFMKHQEKENMMEN